MGPYVTAEVLHTTPFFRSNLNMFRQAALVILLLLVPVLLFATESIGLIGRDSKDGVCVAPLMDWDGHAWKSAPGSRTEPAPDNRTWNEFYDGESVRELTTQKRPTGSCLTDKSNTSTLERFAKLQKSKLALLATTLPHAADSMKWTRSLPSAEEESAAKDVFIKQFKFKRKCVKTEDFPHIVVTKDVLTPQVLRIEPRSFRSKSGDLILGVVTKDADCPNDPYVTDQFYQNHWYWIKKGLNPVEFGNDPEITTTTHADNTVTTSKQYTRRLGIVPIDAGDFAGNGQSYWIFRENGSGSGDMGSATYFLLDPDFKEVAAELTRFYDNAENAER